METALISAITAVVTAILTLIATHKKSDDSKEIEFRNQTLELAQKLQINLANELENLKQENRELRAKINELEAELNLLKNK